MPTECQLQEPLIQHFFLIESDGFTPTVPEGEGDGGLQREGVGQHQGRRHPDRKHVAQSLPQTPPLHAGLNQSCRRRQQGD